MALWLPRDAVRPVKWHATHKWPTWRMKNRAFLARVYGVSLPIPALQLFEWRGGIAWPDFSNFVCMYCSGSVFFFLTISCRSRRFNNAINTDIDPFYRSISYFPFVPFRGIKVHLHFLPSSLFVFLHTCGPPVTWPPIRLDPALDPVKYTVEERFLFHESSSALLDGPRTCNW